MGTPPSNDLPARSNKSFGLGALVDEALLLALHEGLQALAVNGFHVPTILTTEDTKDTEKNLAISVSPVSSVVKALQNVPRQILVFHDVGQHLADVVGVDLDVLAFFVRARRS